jgi:hypothetical protein
MPTHRHVEGVQQVSFLEMVLQCALVVIVAVILLPLHQCVVNAPRGSTAQTQTPLPLRHARTAKPARHVTLKVLAAKHRVLNVRLGRLHPPGLQAVVFAIPGNTLVLLPRSA